MYTEGYKIHGAGYRKGLNVYRTYICPVMESYIVSKRCQNVEQVIAALNESDFLDASKCKGDWSYGKIQVIFKHYHKTLSDMLYIPNQPFRLSVHSWKRNHRYYIGSLVKRKEPSGKWIYFKCTKPHQSGSVFSYDRFTAGLWERLTEGKAKLHQQELVNTG